MHWIFDHWTQIMMTRILFISNTKRLEDPYKDHSTRYRCFNFAEEFIRRGAQADVCPLQTVDMSAVDRYDLFIFHRPSYSSKLCKFLQKLDYHSKRYVADYDDLIFCLDRVKASPQYLNRKATEKKIWKIHSSYQKGLKLFSKVHASTDALAEQLRKHHPNSDIAVVYNGLSSEWFNHAQNLSFCHDGKFRIGYFPGTSSHDADFKLIARPLLQFMETRSDVELLIAGPLNIEHEFRENKVRQVEAVTYAELPQLISQCSVTLAPLKANKFNRCKSNIKLLESLACSVPIISSPNKDFSRIHTDFHQVARLQKEWLAALESSYQSHCLRSQSASHISEFPDVGFASTQTERLIRILDLPNSGPITTAAAKHVKVFGQVKKTNQKSFVNRFGRKTKKLIQDPVRFLQDSWITRYFEDSGRKDV